jgi:N-acetyl-gamma-glutamyl-phosphate reductase
MTRVASAKAAQQTPPLPTLRTAVAGVSGYAGGELARLLLHHPRLASTQPKFFGRAGEASSPEKMLLTDLHPQLATSGASPEVLPFDWQTLVDEGIEILFLATPHEQSREWVPEALARGIRVVDLSGAWRLKDDANRAVYKLKDADAALAAELQREAVYGCPELHRFIGGRNAYRGARLIANPGCYATSIILALAPFLRVTNTLSFMPKDARHLVPLVDLDHGFICDAKSGVSGAGKAATAKTHFMYAADNLSAYAVFGHRHTGELLEQLKLTSDQIQFTPHLLPIPRGILSTIYLRLDKPATREIIEALLRGFYDDCPLVRVRGELPQIQYVARTNYCDIGFELSPDGRRLVLVSCLDNLLKGAAGQAVQNMNLMCGWNEAEGLL